jgi:hypothetical protein
VILPLPPGLSNFVGATTFREAWYSYLRRLQYEGDFTCPCCGTQPDVLVCDAKSLCMDQAQYCGTPITTASGSATPPRT